jgi:hypothetical protein
VNYILSRRLTNIIKWHVDRADGFDKSRQIRVRFDVLLKSIGDERQFD